MCLLQIILKRNNIKPGQCQKSADTPFFIEKKPLTMENFKDKFDRVLIDSLSVTKEQITPDAKFREDLDADSLDMVELLMQYETEFEITIPDEAFDEIKTVVDAENYILNILDHKEIKAHIGEKEEENQPHSY